MPCKLVQMGDTMVHPVDSHVGQQLKKMRIIRGMTQTDVAEGLRISFQQVQKYELGRNRISASRLFELSKILGVETSYFFDGLESQAPDPSTQALEEEATSIATMYAKINDTRVRSEIKTFIREIARGQNTV